MHHFFVIAVLVDVLVPVFVLVIFDEGMGKKKYEFAVSLNVKELTEVPYGNGVFFAKVRLLDGGGGGGSFLAFSNREAIVKNKGWSRISTWYVEGCIIRDVSRDRTRIM